MRVVSHLDPWVLEAELLDRVAATRARDPWGPILVIVPLSFSASSFLSYPVPGWSLQWYDNLFTSAEWGRAAKNSFIVAPLATLIATVLGTMAAVGLARTSFRFKGLLMSLLIAPMVVPIVVVGVGTYLFFANIGLGLTVGGQRVIDEGIFSAVVIMVIVTTMVTPPALKWSLARPHSRREAMSG